MKMIRKENEKQQIKQLQKNMEIEEIKHGIEFSNEPIFIREENKQIVYRFNIGEFSPYIGLIEGYEPVKWDYSSVSAKTSNPEGIFAILPEEEGNVVIFIDRFYQEISGTRKGDETVVLKLEVDKCKLKENERLEVSFPECNILETMTLEDFVIRLFPQYYDLVEWYRIAKANPTESNKKMFNQVWEASNGIAIKAKHKKYLELGRIAKAEYDKKYPNPSLEHSITPEPIEQIYGREHSKRVFQNGLILSASTGANVKVVQLFAMFHDIRRHNDGHDPDHGKRASDLLRTIRRNTPTTPTDLNDTEFEELCSACENHTSLHKTGNITVDTCFDADRLDLTRIGITPSPERMATEIGANFAKNMYLFEAIKKKSNLGRQ